MSDLFIQRDKELAKKLRLAIESRMLPKTRARIMGIDLKAIQEVIDELEQGLMVG